MALMPILDRRLGQHVWRILLAFVLFGIILVIDRWLEGGTHSLLATGIADETAHASTMVILLLGFSVLRSAPFIAGCLVGSVAIDIDHLPLILGSNLLTEETHRPLTHGLLTMGIVLVMSLAARGNWSPFGIGIVVGLAAHFVRDMATSTAGVPLLWPVSTTGFLLPYPIYVALLAFALVRILTRSEPVPESSDIR